MTQILQLLLVVGQRELAERVRHHLASAGVNLSVEIVTTETAFREHLETLPDLIVADAALPHTTLLRCLRLLQTRPVSPPVIVVGEEVTEDAVVYMREGAADFVLSSRLDALGEIVAAARRRHHRHQRLSSSLQARTAEISRLYQSAQALGSTLDPEAVYTILYRIISDVMDCDTLIISRYVAAEERLYCVHSRHEGERHDVSKLPPLPLEPASSGTQSRVVRTGEAFLFNDYQAHIRDNRHLYYVDDEGTLREEKPQDEAGSRSALLVPLKRGEQVHGVLQVHSARLDAYTLEHLLFLETLAPQVAASMINASLYQQAQQELAERERVEAALAASHERLQALADTAMILNQTLDLDEILQRILHNVGKVVPYDGVNISLIKEGRAQVVSAQGYYEDVGLMEQIMQMHLRVDEVENLRLMVESGKPILIGDTATDPRWEVRPESEWVRSYMAVPVQYDDEVIGFLNLDAATPDFFTSEHAERLQAFADHAATALHNARLYRSLEAYSDYLEEAVAERTLELERAVEQMEAILHNSPGGVLLLQTDGLIETGNAAIAQVFNYPLYELFGQPLAQLVAAGQHDKLAYLLRQVVARARPQRAQIEARRADGTTFDAELALAPVQDNERVTGIVCNVYDISALKEVERIKDAFVSNVSHELRTPISSLKLYHGLLLRRPENSAVYMERLGREIDRLSIIIEDLLRLSRLEQGHVSLNHEVVNLNRLVEQYVIDRLPLAQEKSLFLTLEPAAVPLPVSADPGLLGQVLSILLTNAFSYTPAGGEICVGTGTHVMDGQRWARFYVKDSGPGIPSEEQSRLFERFFRGSAGRNSGESGTGLGLAIAREIVERHQGRIDVKNGDPSEHGATFTVWLPAIDQGNRDHGTPG